MKHLFTPIYRSTAGCISSICLVMVFSFTAFAQDSFVEFTRAKNAFDAGEYEEAASRFEKLLEKDFDNLPLLVEIHKYLGVTYLFLEKRELAEEQFIKLLNRAPDFSLDPLIFPIDVVDFFTEIKQTHAERLKKIAQARKKAEQKRKLEEEKKRARELEKLKTTVYLEKNVAENSLLVAFMPFGAGQFQNKEKVKGFIFLGGELLLVTASAITFALHENLREDAKTPLYSQKTKSRYESLEKGYRIANHASLISLGVMILVGMADSIYHYNEKKIKWRRIDKREVPVEYKSESDSKSEKTASKAVAGPILFKRGAGVGAFCTF